MVEAYSIKFYVLAIQEESFVRIEFNCTDTHIVTASIYRFSVNQYGCLQFVQIRGSQTPDIRIVKRKCLFASKVRACNRFCI